MPRVVDHEARRREIATVTLRLLARDGAAAVSIRNIAAEMGGSPSVVTHYYPNRQTLMTDLAHECCNMWQSTLDQLDKQHTEPRARLRAFMMWLLPLNERGHEEERVRIALLASENEPECRAVLLEFDEFLRRMLRQRLRRLVPKSRVAPVADLLRAFASGVVLDDQLDTAAWPAKRQLALLDQLLAVLLPE